ncbi:unnamed protein product [Miscanthus lutarioriparius]|uniref:Uncharacterized protein n=1 Tax=Miscanthus lutarioriparius TaxID=422564 RepID=A0A811MK74_9POAL|nr:unnamed protein product [Miscanthus lutarioriparius]
MEGWLRGPPKSKKTKTNEPTIELSIDAPSLQSAPTMTFPHETPIELAALVTKKKWAPSSSSKLNQDVRVWFQPT